MKTIRIHLGERSHPIILGTGILEALPGLARRLGVPRQVAVVTDTRVAALHLGRLSAALRKGGFQVIEIVIPRGERQKSLARANSIITRLLEARYSRRSAIIAFGGGVVGDVSGFAAATFRRGVPLVQVPTTLLAQVESAIGGKTAVNHPLSKNAIGAYHQPSLVFSDAALLATLPRREIICGVGEILKYGMLDRGILAYLHRHIDEILAGEPAALEGIIRRCNVVKAKLVRDDEREERPGGGRAVLNLGHTVGHALEDLSRYRLRHGEAVVLGLRWELRIAMAAGRVERADAALFEDLLRRIPYHPAIGYIPRDRLIERIVAQAASAGFIIPRKIGSVTVARDIPPALIRRISRAFRP